ncbi:MAG TPA: DUF3455 domain-containing protein [Methylibium sp.]|nr:DUF3455 domain-containing protein [Methylibium sp.]
MIRPLFALSVSALLVACTVASRVETPAAPRVAIPAALAPASGDPPALRLAATGVQIYECRATAGASPTWGFVGPEAELFDAAGRSIGRHGAGPHWQAHDGSRLDGKVRARANAPSPAALPWLLLDATASGPRGVFSGVTAIQRVNTVGGAAPPGACSADTAGTAVRVPYTADYLLYSAAHGAP